MRIANWNLERCRSTNTVRRERLGDWIKRIPPVDVLVATESDAPQGFGPWNAANLLDNLENICFPSDKVLVRVELADRKRNWVKDSFGYP